jgi:hypothetical protein
VSFKDDPFVLIFNINSINICKNSAHGFVLKVYNIAFTDHSIAVVIKYEFNIIAMINEAVPGTFDITCFNGFSVFDESAFAFYCIFTRQRF